jgi:hypothetical protein
MNALTTTHEQPLAVLSTENEYLLFNDSKMNQIIRVAEIMATGKTTIPEHLRNSPGDCMAVCLQAAQWKMNPMAVAQKTHLVSGRLGYEAQLVIAVVNTRAPIQGRLKFTWEGDWSNVNGKTSKDEHLAVTCSATFQGDTEPTAHRVSMAQAGVRNSPLWEHDPKMQLAYLCAKRWARLHCPDVILGVYTPDELESPVPIISEPDPPSATRTEAVKNRLKRTIDVTPENSKNVSTLHEMLRAGEVLDESTGEILNAEPVEPEDPIAALILVISECQTREELETHRAAVAGLKNGLKKRAIDAWKAVEARLPKAA